MSDSGKHIATRQSSEESVAQTVVKNLQCEASALKGAAERATRGQPPDLRPLIIAGAEIVFADRNGLLSHILQLEKIAPEVRRLEFIKADGLRRKANQSAQEPTKVGSAGEQTSPTTRWILMTGTEIERLRQNPRTFKIPDHSISSRPSSPAPLSAFGFSGGTPLENPGFICACAVMRCWRHLSRKHREALSPAAAHVFLTMPKQPEIWQGGEDEFVKAAWVCEFLANSIGREHVKPVSAEQVEAEAFRKSIINPLKGHKLLREIRKHYSLSKVEAGRLRKRLEYFRENHNGRVKTDNVPYRGNDGEQKVRLQYRYPADVAHQFVTAIRDKNNDLKK